MKLDLNKPNPSGNVAVDMCCACIVHNTKLNQPLKAIELNWVYFSIFQNWVIANFSELATKKEFYICGVKITKSKERDSKIITEIWENK